MEAGKLLLKIVAFPDKLYTPFLGREEEVDRATATGPLGAGSRRVNTRLRKHIPSPTRARPCSRITDLRNFKIGFLPLGGSSISAYYKASNVKTLWRWLDVNKRNSQQEILRCCREIVRHWLGGDDFLFAEGSNSFALSFIILEK